MSTHEILVELQQALKAAEKEKVDLTENETGSFADFQKRKKEGTRLKLTGILQRLTLATKETELSQLVQQLNNTQNVGEMKKILDKLADKITPEEKQKNAFNSRMLPSEVREEIQADIAEAQRCFENACYRSAVILCGRVLETALHRKYFEKTGNDLLEKAPGTGLGNLIAKLAEKGIKLEPGLMNQIHLVNQVRVYSVHTKQETFRPTQNQAQAIMLYTIDVLDKLFRA